jgi:hypothetical protein
MVATVHSLDSSAVNFDTRSNSPIWKVGMKSVETFFELLALQFFRQSDAHGIVHDQMCRRKLSEKLFEILLRVLIESVGFIQVLSAVRQLGWALKEAEVAVGHVQVAEQRR